MGVTIKTVGGRVLYVAEAAQDVLAAVQDAILRDARLRDADLRDAILSDADLSDADLRGADLRGADLSGAILRGARLRGADLSGARLSDAILRGADLSGADDPSSPLFAFRVDVWSILDQAPAEAAGLRAALADGLVDGSVYEGECACLIGTIANVRGVPISEVGLPKVASRLAEQWFLPIRRGDTPDPASLAVERADAGESKPDERPLDRREGVFRATLAVQWIDEWVESRRRLVEALGRER